MLLAVCWMLRSRLARRRLDAIEAITGGAIDIATMDAGYAYDRVFRVLEDRDIEGIVPAKAESPPGKIIPTRYHKLTLTFLATVQLAAIIILLN
ncbi:hypothetical protein D3W54_10455 [Komagataeibacter medellinensis]|uniref:Transposase n=1 Tax=Komagataeibacter medellinensis TaxID=1177712 RepID=A0ABQ6W1C7_9PROT|nr:hypothetical protein D3W54_10455 [Komagataeibacter medellinensis]